MRKMSKEDIDGILALFDGENTIMEIVNKSGYSLTTVRNLMLEHGLNHYGVSFRQNRMRQAYEMSMQEGVRWSDISKKLGYIYSHTSRAAAITYARRHNLPLPKCGRRNKKLEDK